MRVGVLGLGEAGRTYSRDLLASGVTVTGYDPDPAAIAVATKNLPKLRLAASEGEAVVDVDLVLSAVTAAHAVQALRAALKVLSRSANSHTVYADLNTGSPGLKAELARAAAMQRVAFADVAIMAPVERAGLRTALLASGNGTPRIHDLLKPLGVPIDDVGTAPGEAARMKLLRSIFVKGLAGVVLEGLTAAERAGGATSMAWLRNQMAAELGADGAEFVDHLVESSTLHASRRAHEMDDAANLVAELEVPGWMTEGSRRWLHALASMCVSPPPIDGRE